MSDQTYNGWTNWATWNFNMWIDNDEQLYNIVENNLVAFKGKDAQLKWLEIVAENVVNTELCPDLKKSDIESINFQEILEVKLEDK